MGERLRCGGLGTSGRSGDWAPSQGTAGWPGPAGGCELSPGTVSLTPRGGSVPLPVLSWNSERKRVMRSEGMAKEMPAATLSVLMPMTSPSWAGDQSGRSLRENKRPLGSVAEQRVHATQLPDGRPWPSAPSLRSPVKVLRGPGLSQGPPSLLPFTSTPDPLAPSLQSVDLGSYSLPLRSCAY